MSTPHALALIAPSLGPANRDQNKQDNAKRVEFRVNTCTLHPSGALLLDESDRFAVDAQLRT
jgi:hypothetical protein